MNYELPILKYNFSDLEPVMDKETVEIHYTKHHQAYINNLNAALKDQNINLSLTQLLTSLDSLPKSISQTVRNNGGGHFNHTLFWNVLTKEKNQTPSGKLLDEINATFGSFDNFKQEFENAGKKHFGSGWVWLIKNLQNQLQIVTLPNQDTPLLLGTPILAIDLWEHSYYLKYQNKRADYLQNIWQIINWRYVEELFNN